MPRQLTCPDCAEEDNLSGERTEDGIHITCEACGARWPRDTPHTCATCGGDDIHMRGQAVTQYSRGTQLSIVGMRHIPLCASCDAEMLARANQQKPVPGQYRSAAAGRADGEGSSTSILPT
ncbi:hypothetical protein RIF23_05040 [Lipingzhangella sp. LS1_29]|uniref:Uncharacterized protein n=1 Tax=Lipingzhangella rawalii TaxID=2055835 RepID=A0ABU2H481_9ACTN|nr:hypothetical protein [Lipingzhangella rawalii]MDS1269655.1 hypothetical protein [Lipingzhangella rawalii]